MLSVVNYIRIAWLVTADQQSRCENSQLRECFEFKFCASPLSVRSARQRASPSRADANACRAQRK